MKKRLLSILLAVIMVVTLMPTMAFAVVTKPDSSDWLVDEGDNHVWYKLENGNTTLTIGGTGAMPDFNAETDQPWDNVADTITTVNIGQDVTRIGNYAFSGCSSLASVTCFAENLPTLENNAFASCDNLQNIYVPEQLVDAYKAAQGWSEYADKISGKHIHDGIVFEPCDSFPSYAGNWYLTLKDGPSYTSPCTVHSDTFNLCLNGCSIKTPGGGGISVANNATLNLYDCDETVHYWNKNETTGLWTRTSNESEYKTTGGYFTSGEGVERKGKGGSVEVFGTLNMYGGNIVGNTTTNGGGVYVYNSGTLNMYGGSIVGNAAANGGGVYNGGTFNMYGGTIAGCTETAADAHSGGGGVYNNGTFTMNGGTIAGCTAKGKGGGVYNNGTFTMSAGSIQECRAEKQSDSIKGHGGGVWNQASFTLSGGCIQNNKASNNGGGVGNAGGGSITINSGSINDNMATGSGGGITSDGDVTMSDGTILNNTAGSDGGGVRFNGTDNGADKTFTMTGGTIANNTAGGNGGGLNYVSGTVVLGGTAKITGNVKDGTITDGVLTGGTANNLYLTSGKTVTLGTGTGDGGNGVAVPADGMSVGVTKGEPKVDNPVAFTSNGAEGYAKYFFSDNADCYVEEKYDNTNQKYILQLVYGYPIWIGDKQVTKDNCTDVLGEANTVSYNSLTNTLTLDNAKIMTSADKQRNCAIKSLVSELNIQLIGTNQLGVTVADSNLTDDTKYNIRCGIEAGDDGNINFVNSDGGKLIIYDKENGIFANKITFADTFNGEIVIFDNVYKNEPDPQPPCAIHACDVVEINSGTFKLLSTNANGIYAENYIAIDGATVNITAGAVGLKSSSASISINNSTVTIRADEKGIDADGDKVTINNANVTVNASNIGINVLSGLIIDSSKLTVTAQNYALNKLQTLGESLALKAGSNASDTVEMTAEQFNANPTEYKYLTIAQKEAPAPVYSGGGSSSSTFTVPVTGDENTVKVSATVSGSTATVNKIKDADLEKVTDGESVSIDLSGLNTNIDTAKIPTETVEKIAEKSAMTVKLPVATVEFDKTATEEIVGQAKGSNIELVVDDIKTVSLNAVQKESVKKLDTAIIIDAYLASNGSKLCTADNGGFGGGRAKVILPYEIKNNRTAANYSVYYVNENGNRQRLVSVYDEELKAFVFEIEHFSIYALAYDEYVMPFVDVPENRFFYEPIKWAAKNQITDGVDATHFNPFGITNRAQMVTFLWKAAGRPEPTITKTSFKDLDSNRYYYKAVLWAYENGITDGTTATTFEPNANVSRAQVVTFLWRYAGEPVVNYFIQMTDVESGRYYTEAVRWALSEKITNGTTSKTFSPKDDCLRGQIVTFLYRVFEE